MRGFHVAGEVPRTANNFMAGRALYGFRGFRGVAQIAGFGQFDPTHGGGPRFHAEVFVVTNPSPYGDMVGVKVDLRSDFGGSCQGVYQA